jgi:regulator of nonsense transcripts 1
VANSELTDTTTSVIGGKGISQGGVSLGAGLHDAVTGMRPVSYTQSDRLKQYVESNGRIATGNGFGRRYDDDEKSISTAFHSQIGGGYD